jgi:hypothetical protein
MRAHHASIVRGGVILLLVLAVPAGIAWGIHSLDHLVATGMLQDDLNAVSSECTLLSSCESAEQDSAPAHSDLSLLAVTIFAPVPAFAGNQCARVLLVFPPNPLAARSHRPG